MTEDTRTDVDETAESISIIRELIQDVQSEYARFTRRSIWIFRILVGVIAGAAIGGSYVQWQLHDTVDKIQQERARNTLRACTQANQQNAAIRGFVVNSLPVEAVRNPTVKNFLEKHPELAPVTTGRNTSGTGERPPAPGLVIEYLERTSETFPARNCKRELKDRIKGV